MKKKILIIDENQDFAQTRADNFRHRGYEVETVAIPSQAAGAFDTVLYTGRELRDDAAAIAEARARNPMARLVVYSTLLYLQRNHDAIMKADAVPAEMAMVAHEMERIL